MANAGDGAPVAPTTAVVTKDQMPTTPLPDASGSQEELEAKINVELGIPAETPKADSGTTADDTTTQDNVPTGTDSTTPDETTETDEPAGEENAEEAEPEENVEPTPPAAPSDEELFIEIEDADGVTHKISNIDDLPDDFTYKNARQPVELMQQLSDLKAKIDSREQERAQAQLEADRAAEQKNQFDLWDKEIADLGKNKQLDPKDSKYIDKVFTKMTEINEARAKAGNTNFVTSFEDALMYLKQDEAKQAAADEKKEENDRAKAKATLIGGSSSSSSGNPQPYISGRYRSIEDVPV